RPPDAGRRGAGGGRYEPGAGVSRAAAAAKWVRWRATANATRAPPGSRRTTSGPGRTPPAPDAAQRLRRSLGVALQLEPSEPGEAGGVVHRRRRRRADAEERGQRRIGRVVHRHDRVTGRAVALADGADVEV